MSQLDTARHAALDAKKKRPMRHEDAREAGAADTGKGEDSRNNAARTCEEPGNARKYRTEKRHRRHDVCLRARRRAG